MVDENQKKVSHAYALMRRETIREGLSTLFLARYDLLCEALQDSYWVPYQGLRSFEKQNEYYAQGRTAPGRIVTHAQAGYSAHNWGCATDWAEMRPEFTGQEMWNKADWEGFADAVRGVGLVWGGDFKGIVDKPHCELGLDVSWKRVGDVYRAHGVEAATEFIYEHSQIYTGGISK